MFSSSVHHPKIIFRSEFYVKIVSFFLGNCNTLNIYIQCYLSQVINTAAFKVKCNSETTEASRNFKNLKRTLRTTNDAFTC